MKVALITAGGSGMGADAALALKAHGFEIGIPSSSGKGTVLAEEQGGGAIVNISTFAAFEPDPVFPTSGVFRARLAAFAKLFADAYADKGVRMNNLLPGFIDSLPEKDEFRARIPMGRYGRSRGEIAETVAFLVSEGAGNNTGQNIRVDGGITRSV